MRETENFTLDFGTAQQTPCSYEKIMWIASHIGTFGNLYFLASAYNRNKWEIQANFGRNSRLVNYLNTLGVLTYVQICLWSLAECADLKAVPSEWICKERKWKWGIWKSKQFTQYSLWTERGKNQDVKGERNFTFCVEK